MAACGTDAERQTAATTAPAPLVTSMPVPSVPETAVPPTTASASAAPDPSPGSTSSSTVTPSTHDPPGVDPAHVDAAIADLAGWLGVDPADVTVADTELVTWRDAALGCPSTGATYDTEPVDGYRIVLIVDDVDYTYHGALGRPPRICLFLD